MHKFDVTVTESRQDVPGKYPVIRIITKNYKATLPSVKDILADLLGDIGADKLELTIKAGSKTLNVKAVRQRLDVKA